MDKPSNRRLKRERARSRRDGGAVEVSVAVDSTVGGHEQREPMVEIAPESQLNPQLSGASGVATGDGETAVLTRSDMRTVRRLMRRDDWPYDPEKRAALMDELHQMLTSEIKVSSTSDDPDREIQLAVREKIMAAKTILAADAINAKRETTDVTADRQEKSGTVVNVDNRRVVLMLPDNGRDAASLEGK